MKKLSDSLSRRTLLAVSTACAAHSMLPRHAPAAETTKPNSDFGGVHIGCITYSYRGGADTAQYTLDCVLKDGISDIGGIL